MHRYVGGRQTFYPVARRDDNADGSLRPRSLSRNASTRRGGGQDLLTEEQRVRLQAFVERFDAAPGLEPALRLVATECRSFGAFQACKALQRVAKRFGVAAVGDPRLMHLVERCGIAMSSADGVSASRALWALGKLGIRDQATMDAAAARITALIGECGPITIATVWSAFEALNFQPSECLDRMSEAIMQRLDECDPPEVAIVLHAAAQLKFAARDALFAALMPHVREQEGTFGMRHLAVCFHAAARVGFRDEAFCHLVVARFARGAEEADTLAFTSVVYACGLLAYSNEALLQKAAAFVERALASGGRALTPQQTANFVYAFGKLGFRPEGALLAASQYALADMNRFRDQELSNLTYGFGLLKFNHEPFLAQLSRHLTEEGRAATLDAQSIVSIVYACALLGHCHQTTLRALGDYAILKLPDFRAEEFSILVYSLGVLNFRHHDLLTAVVEHAPAALPRFSTQNLSNLLHGLGLVSFDRNDDFIRKVASHLAGRLAECSPQDIANSLTALARLTVPHDDLLRAIATYMTAPGTRLPWSAFTTQEIANTVYSFDALQVFDAKLFEQAASETERRLEEFIPQEVANVLWAFAKSSFGSVEWFEAVLSRCLPYAEALPRGTQEHTLATDWCAEDLEKPLGALAPLRDQLPSYARLENAFRTRFLGPIANFLKSVEPPLDRPAPSQYQKDFAAWDLYQVGPLYTEELLGGVGVSRAPLGGAAVQTLLDHYIGAGPDSLLARYGDKMLHAVLPAARWVSSHMTYRLSSPGAAQAQGRRDLEGGLVVEPARPEDAEANSRRFAATQWRQAAGLPGAAAAGGAFRPVLLSTFLGNWRHRHTEVVALDALVEVALGAVADGSWPWSADFWQNLEGDVDLLVPHTPCLSCVGAFAQLRAWAPRLRIRVAYEDWRDWRGRLLEATPGRPRMS